MKRLVTFGGFADDSQGILAAVQRLTLVLPELICDLRSRCQSDADRRKFCAAIRANAVVFDESELVQVLRHTHSFPQAEPDCYPCGIQTAPLPERLEPQRDTESLV